MILSDFAKALGQIGDPRFRRVLWWGVGLTLALLVAAYAGLLQLAAMADPGPVSLPFLGEITWIGDLLTWGSALFMLFLSVFLMIPVASAITSMFLDDVAQAVEDRHYPHLPPLGQQSLWDAFRDTINFLGVLIGANLLAFFAYAVLPFAAPLIFYGLNGFLLGREYFTVAAMRREGRAGAEAMRRANLPQIWMAGVLMALPLTVPLMNLFIPILGAATFTHLYHRLAGSAPAPSV
ncbi:EI24 domain-containing protein [Salibaculum halophilum]|uniref:EI24 domain-containing protein n=1 Tax=Salibaculum halophilum TaxID=1914408 RepID=UPI000A1198E5|nr:EI24 domain-containing protein [Salibaculum halophilum]